MCLFFSSFIYHKVAKFYPKTSNTKDQSQGIAPGRIGTVFFFPRVSYETLQDKPPGWGYRTGFGMNSNMFVGEEEDSDDEVE